MRVANRVLALILALALVVVSVIVVIEIAAKSFGQSAQVFGWHGMYKAGHRDSWESSGVRALLGVLAFVGLLLVLSQLRPRRPDRLRLDRKAISVDAGLTRRAVSQVLTGAAMEVPGVSKVSATLKRRRVKLDVTTRYGDQSGADSVKPQVESAVKERLEALKLRHSPSTRITVKPGRS